MEPTITGSKRWKTTLGPVARIAVAALLVGGAKGLVRAELAGPALLTGGTSGIEGSVLALLACLAVGAYLLSRARRKGRFVEQAWTQHHAPGRQEGR